MTLHTGDMNTTQTTSPAVLTLGDSGHVHGLSLTVTYVDGSLGFAVDHSGREWMLAPMHSDGTYALMGTGRHSRTLGRVTVAEGTLHAVVA